MSRSWCNAIGKAISYRRGFLPLPRLLLAVSELVVVLVDGRVTVVEAGRVTVVEAGRVTVVGAGRVTVVLVDGRVTVVEAGRVTVVLVDGDVSLVDELGVVTLSVFTSGFVCTSAVFIFTTLYTR